MKLHADNSGFEGMLPQTRIAMKIKNSAKMFEILSSGIYKDKILAVIREYCCNAFDAHVSAGKRDVPFTVQLPNRLEPTFSVTDEGTGIYPHGHDEEGNYVPHKNIGDVFWTYGESSKTNDNETIGALGLGSKSAFAYTKSSFIVRDRFDGVEYVYFCFIDEHGEPSGSPVGEDKTDKPNGITVEFAVRPEDIPAFIERFQRLFRHWGNVKPNVVGVNEDLAFDTDPERIIEGNNKDWYLETKTSAGSRTGALAIMGNVQYPIESESIPNLPPELKIIANNPFVINFGLGSLEFAASRESLSYTEWTSKVLIARLEEVRAEVASSFHDRVFKQSADHLSFLKNFSATFAEFRNVVVVPQSSRHSYGVEDDTMKKYTLLLLDKNHDDYIEFMGAKFKIVDLINSQYVRTVEHYQTVGLYKTGTRGKSKQRFFLEPATRMTFKSKIDMQAHDLYQDTANYTVSAGTNVIKNQDWRGKYTSPRAEVRTFDVVISQLENFDVTMSTIFPIDKGSQKLVIVVNDVGSTGRERFKCIVEGPERNKLLPNAQLIYAEYNLKVTTVDQAQAELQMLIDSSLTGATVKLLSELPDLRKPIVKAKVDKGSIKLKVWSFTQSLGNEQQYQVASDILTNSITVDVKGLTARPSEDRIMSLDDLTSRKEVHFIIKRRTQGRYYDNVRSYVDAHTGDMKLLSFCSHNGFFDDAFVKVQYPVRKISDDGSTYHVIQVEHNSLEVLIITEGQHEWLVKHGVKLVSLSNTMKTKIKAVEEKEHFFGGIKHLVKMSNVKILRTIYDNLQRWSLIEEKAAYDNPASLFKTLFGEYVELRSNTNSYGEHFIKRAIFHAVCTDVYLDVDHEVESITHQLKSRYPMLELLNFSMLSTSAEKAQLILQYFDQMDFMMSQCVKSAAEEVVSQLMVHEEA